MKELSDLDNKLQQHRSHNKKDTNQHPQQPNVAPMEEESRIKGLDSEQAPQQDKYQLKSLEKRKRPAQKKLDPDLQNKIEKYEDLNKNIRADSLAQKNAELKNILDIHQVKYESPQHYGKYAVQQIYKSSKNRLKLDALSIASKSKNKYNILDIEGESKPLQSK